MKKLILLVMLLAALSSRADIVVTIGTGTGYNDSGTYPAPYGNYYWGARHQFLYTASELAAAGLGAGNITTVAFNVIAVNGALTHQGYTVQMKNTSTTSLTAWESGLSTVLNPAPRTPVTGWNTYTLDVPFFWDGTSNLIVEVCFNNTSWVANASTQWTTTLTGNKSIWYNNDISNVCSSSSIQGMSNIRPNIQFTGQEVTPCSGTPDPGNTISTSYSVCPSTNFTLSLQNSTAGSGVAYQWQSSSDGYDPWTNIGTSMPTYNGVQTSDTWYRCQVTCSGNTGISTPALIEMASITSCYCIPVYSTGCETYGIGVTYFSLNTISQTITCAGTPSYYHDFSSLSTDLTLNQNYSIEVQTGPTYGIYLTVWIDYNQNGMFDLPGEQAAQGSCFPPNPSYIPFSVDGNALTGPTRLRIMSRYSGYGWPDNPCSLTELYGNCADFTVNINSIGNLAIVETTAATGIGPYTATINGTINANDYETNAWFEYGTSTSYSTMVSAVPGTVAGNVTTPVSAALTSLEPNTIFHYRVKGGNSAGNAYGNDMTFSTDLIAPTVSTGTATSITNYSATLNALVNANNSLSTAYFEYGLSDLYGSEIITTPSSISGYYNQAVSAALTGLDYNTTYHYRIVSVNDGGTSYGDDLTFTTFNTPYCLPVYSTGCDIYNVGLTNFNLNTISQIIPCTGVPSYFHDYTTTSTDLAINGYYPITVTGGTYPVYFRVWIDYNQDNFFDPGTELACQGYAPATVNTTVYFTVNGSSALGYTGLRIMSKYESYGYPTNPCSISEIYGNCADFGVNIISFGTLPSASTAAATDITAYTATLNGVVNANDYLTSVWFEYGTSTAYGTTVTAAPAQVDGNSETPVIASLTGLSYNTTYHFRMKAGNSAGTVYGDDQIFVTLMAPPTVFTYSATNLQGTTATLNGMVNANESNSDVYFEYGLTDAYGSTIIGNPAVASGNYNTGVSADLSGLEKNTTYHFRIVATNVGGTSYGNDMTFTTFNTDYCVPYYSNGCGWGDGLNYFELNTIAQTIPCTGTPSWFHDYTALSTDLVYNSNYTISVKAGFSNTYVIIWIDYNQNEVFDASENCGQVNCTSANTIFTIPLYIPGESLPGPTTLRAITEYAAWPTSPCGSFVWGNCQDFTVNIVSIGILPTLMTNAATDITGYTSNLHATVNANNYSTYTWFEYGLTSEYGITVTGVPAIVEGITDTPVSYSLTGLYPNSTYHFRIKGGNTAGNAYGEDLTFTTDILPPTVYTASASPIGNYYATLNGTVNANNMSSEIYFEYGPDLSYGYSISGTPSTVNGVTDQPVSAGLTGLELGTTYHYRIVSTSDAGTSYGDDMTFTTFNTSYCLPVYSMGCELNDMMLNSFSLNTISQTIPCSGNPSYFQDFTLLTTDLAINGYYEITVTAGNNFVYYKVWIDYNQDDIFDDNTETIIWGYCPALGNSTNFFFVSEDAQTGSTGLRIMSSSWHYPAPCSTTEADGNCADFTVNITDPVTPPVVITQPASGVTAHDAVLNGSINPNGNLTGVEFQYQFDSYTYIVAGTPSPVTGDIPVAVSAALSSLFPNTTYYYFVIGYGPGGYIPGDQLAFTTDAIPPSVETLSVTSIGGTSAYLHANVNSNNLPATSYFEYGTDLTYGQTLNGIPLVTEGHYYQQVDALLTGLEMNATYHYRVVSTNDEGTTYGEDMTFTTLSNLYCIPFYNTGCDYYNIGLTYFELNAIAQSIICTGTPSYYHDFTSSSTDLAQNGYYAYTVTGGDYPIYFTIWIDYNQDNNFDNATETVTNAYCDSYATTTQFLAINESELTGPTRLRIMSRWYGYSYPTDPCSPTEEYGNCTDFAVNIIDALTPPTVTTQAATDVTGSAAVLHGTVNANGNATSVNFLWGWDGWYGNTTAASPNSITGNTTTDVTGMLTNLAPNYTYNYKTVGFGPGGYITGNEITFTTDAIPPDVVSISAINLGGYSVRLSGQVNANNSSTEVFFEYGTDLTYGSSIVSDPSTIEGFYNQNVYATVTGLVPGTEYHFRIAGTNVAGTGYGDDMTVTVLNSPYCVPYYYTGCEVYNVSITHFQLGTIAQTIECTGTPSYYHDYTAGSETLDLDSTYTITVTAGSYNVYYSVWIDYNQDYFFDFASEMVGQAYCQAFLNSSFEFTVDGDALPGTTRLRVMSRYESYGYPTDPCSSYEDYGNCADFGINVNQPVYMIWTGMVSDEWNNPGNWNEPAVPGATDKVLVPSAPAGGNVFPVVPVSGGPYSIRRLTIETGAIVTLTSGSLLNISDD